MAFDNLLITTKRKIGGIKVDGVITETTQVTMRVTTNPVESGANISDHIIEEPLRYSMTGVITDSPIGIEGITQLAGSVVDAVTGIFGQSEQGRKTRSKQLYKELVSMMRSRQLITVKTSLEDYDDLIFESISVNGDKDTSNGVHFSATFVQALLVHTAREIIDRGFIDTDENKAAYASFTNAGFNGTVPATDNEILTYQDSLGL